MNFSCKHLVCIVTALSVISAVGCGSQDKDKKTTSAKKTQSVSADAGKNESVSSEETSPAESADEVSSVTEKPYEPGELLAKAAAVFDGAYTYEVEITYSDEPDVLTERTQASDGENTYVGIRRTGSDVLTTDTFYISMNGSTFSADNNLMAYASADELGEVCLLKSIIDNKLERTYTHLPEDAEGMTVEEYTYAGDTFITVYDLYFAEDGSLAKYTALYTTEGEDQLEETAVVKSMKAEYDGSCFEEDNLADYTDFDGMTEDERLGFCQKICGDYSISTDDMYSLGITTNDLKTITFDKFCELVYKFAKPAEEGSSSESDKKKDKDKDKDSSSDDSKTSEDNSTEQ